MKEKTALKLIRLARYFLRRAREYESNGQDASAYRRIFRLLIRTMKQVVDDGISSERMEALSSVLDRFMQYIDKKVKISGNLLDNEAKSGIIKLESSHDDGGAGSGNWGHKGVPGQLGGSVSGGGVQNRTGSSETGYSSEAKELAKAIGASGGSGNSPSSSHPKSGSKAAEDHDLGPGVSKSAQVAYDKARENEAKITPKLQEIAGGLSCEMRGLEYSVKTASSTRDKIERKRHDALKSGKAAPSDEEIVKGMGDLVRYTAVSPHDQMSGTARKFMDKLSEEGYTVTKLENKWLDPKPYNGIHLDVVSDAGQKFELQIHSNESLSVKDKLHPLYEERRKTTTSDKRKAELDEEMMNLSKSLNRPKGIDDLKSFERS